MGDPIVLLTCLIIPCFFVFTLSLCQGVSYILKLQHHAMRSSDLNVFQSHQKEVPIKQTILFLI